MKVVFPVEFYQGDESALYGHFGSAPGFALLDTDTGVVEPMTNGNRDHEHGACNPLQALGQQPVDAIVVGGIGPGALNGLRRAGIRVFKSDARTIREAAESLQNGSLLEVAMDGVCGHSHGNGGCGCSHAH
jgi:predicted Fe-Mo cluster-binding NifX family protein